MRIWSRLPARPMPTTTPLTRSERRACRRWVIGRAGWRSPWPSAARAGAPARLTFGLPGGQPADRADGHEGAGGQQGDEDAQAAAAGAALALGRNLEVGQMLV